MSGRRVRPCRYSICEPSRDGAVTGHLARHDRIRCGPIADCSCPSQNDFDMSDTAGSVVST